MQPIPIPEPYWNAGKEFRWDKIYSQTGIPIPTEQLKGNGYIYVRVQNKNEIWVISKQRAISIVNRFKSRKKVNEVDVCIIPWGAFQKA